MDSNVNLLNKNLAVDKFMDLWATYGFSNLIKTSTRITRNSSSLIDQVFINNQALTGSSGVIASDVSDHLLCFINIDINCHNEKPTVAYKRLFSPVNVQIFKENLANINWNTVVNEPNITVAYSNFVDLWSFIFEQSFPLKRIFVNKNKFPINEYFSKGLLVSCNKKMNFINLF